MTALTLQECEALKAAGFPQDECSLYYLDGGLQMAQAEGGEYWIDEKFYPYRANVTGRDIACPHLGELLAALTARFLTATSFGTRIINTFKLGICLTNEGWSPFAYVVIDGPGEDDYCILHRDGDTPEQAVAALYIALAKEAA